MKLDFYEMIERAKPKSSNAKNPTTGPRAGCRRNRPIGFAPWPAEEEWDVIYEPPEHPDWQERRLMIAMLPEGEDDM